MSLAIHDSIKFLEEAARYFEHRPTNGEDNVYNAEHCQEIIKEIKKLREDNLKLLKRLDFYKAERDRYSHAYPEISGQYFIAGGYGETDDNQLPQYIRIVPAYGAGWEQVYERTDKTISLEGS